MQPVTNASNLEPLKNQIRTIKEGTIRLASGWIRANTLREVLGERALGRIRTGKIELKLLLRIGSPKDVEITDAGVFELLQELKAAPKARIEWRYSPKHHSKLYIVGSNWAMVGSFNLTGGGFGTDDNPGSNPEAGAVTNSPEEVRELIDLFDGQFADASELPNDLVGIVANGSAHDEFWAFGTRHLASGTFVQIRGLDGDTSILARVERSFRMHESFFQASEDPTAINPAVHNLLARGSDLLRHVKGVALSGAAQYGQLSVLFIKPIRTIVPNAAGKPDLEPCRLPPAVGAPICLPDPVALAALFHPSPGLYAHLEENKDIPVSFANGEVLSKHMAVLGGTGSGKSYFVKRFVERSLANDSVDGINESLRIVLIDTHGEYSPEDFTSSVAIEEVLPDEKAIARATAAPVTDPEDVLAEISAVSKRDIETFQQALAAAGKERSEGAKQKAFVGELRKEIQRRSQSSHETVDWLTVLEDLRSANAPEEKKPSKDPLGAVGWQYAADLEACNAISNSDARKRLRALITQKHLAAIKSAVGAPKTAEVETSGLEETVTAISDGRLRLSTLNLVDRLRRPGVYRLDLRHVHEPEIRQAIVGDLFKEVFESAKTARAAGKSFRTVFVVDEAQNYAPERASRSIPSFRWMKVIASEGRKFGVGLIVVTQRPAYLSKDVLAQCNSQAIFRLINGGDLDQVANTVEGISETDLQQIPQFATGQAVFTGVGVTLPVRVRVEV